MSLDNFIVQLRFFLPSKSLTLSILDLNSEFLGEPSQQTRGVKKKILGFVTGRSRVEHHQRVIAERLYRYLASVARDSDQSDEIVYIWECIPHGIAPMLGFPEYTKIQVRTDIGIRAITALHALTTEFRDWLRKQDSYQAPWGELQMIDDDRLRLAPDTPRDCWNEEPAAEVEWEGYEHPTVGAGSVVRGA